MAGAFGDGTFSSGTFGGSGAAAITTATVARTVVIPLPKISALPEDSLLVAGDDILYLVASHDPTVIVVARRGTMKTASHGPALIRKVSHAGHISKIASANRPIS